VPICFPFFYNNIFFVISFSPPPLNLALVLLGLAIVADGDEEDVARVFGHLLRVVAAVYLVDGGAGGVVILQLDDDGRCRDVLPRHEHEVGEARSRLVLAVEDVVAVGVEIGDGEHARHGVLVAVPDQAGVVGVGVLHHACHGSCVAAQGGV